MDALAGLPMVVGSIDGVYDEKICGWALTQGAPGESTPLVFEFDGGVIRRFETHYCRADVAGLGYPADNTAGFAFPMTSLTREELTAILASGAEEVVHCSLRSGDALLAGSPCAINRQQLVLAVLAQSKPLAIVGNIDVVSHAGVRGWCLEPGADMSLMVALKIDGRVVGIGRADLDRPDVALGRGVSHSACGFDIPIPAILFDGGPHSVTVEDLLHRRAIGPPRAFNFLLPENITTRPDLVEELRSFLAQGASLLRRFEREAHTAAAEITSWDHVFRTAHQTPPAALQRQSLMQRSLGYRPLISVVMPLYNTVKWMLIEAIESVRAQTYDHWELIIVDDASTDDGVRDLAHRHAVTDPARIRTIFASENGGISVATNLGLAEAKGDYIAFFDHDDLLEPDALFAIVEALQVQRFRLLYTDEDSITEDHDYRDPHFKPSWDPVLLCGLNYVCHFVVVEHALLRQAGPLDPAFDGAQDKEFLLRLSRHIGDADVLHIPRVLYHWRNHTASFSKTEVTRERLTRRTQAASLAWAEGQFGSVRAEAVDPPGMYAVKLLPGMPAGEAPLVSVIIPTRDRSELVAECTASLLQGTYPNLEIIIVDHESEQALSTAMFRILGNVANTRVIRYRGAFNWSAINNHAAAQARGEYLLFLNNDTVMITPDAITQMLAYAQLADAGAVGARLLYGDGRTQHIGVQLGAAGIAAHGFAGHHPEELVYFGYPKLTRSVAAVTGACLLVRRDLFDQVGGFDVGQLGVALSDIDFCLKLLLLGRRNIVVSTAEFFHHESASRGSDETAANRKRFAAECTAFQKRWSSLIDADPFYNPNFELRGDPYRRLSVKGPPDYLFRLQAKQAMATLMPLLSATGAEAIDGVVA